MPNVIDQMTEGHEYLYSLFGVRPLVGWQIDPFGHSSAAPVLYSGMVWWCGARVTVLEVMSMHVSVMTVSCHGAAMQLTGHRGACPEPCAP